MRSLVVYESMYGNTHLIADAIGRGLAAEGATVEVVPVEEATPERLAATDLLVVGGPTHMHGLSRDLSRKQAVNAAAKQGSELHPDPDAEGEGLREWFDALPTLEVAAAAFDTRFHGAPILTGRASNGISKRLRHHRCREVAEPESFFVTKDNTLDADEQERAVGWGRNLARAVPAP